MSDAAALVSILPLAAVVVPAIAAVFVYRIADQVRRERGLLIGSILTTVIIGAMILALLVGEPSRFSAGAFAPGIPFELVGDPLGVAFAGFVALVYLAATPVIVSSQRRAHRSTGSRVYACLLGSQAAVLCAALAGNVLILFGALEVFTLVTYPLIANSEDRQSRLAGYTYLVYGFTGGIAVLFGTRLVYAETGVITFVSGGIPAVAAGGGSWALTGAGILLVLGFGVKAAIVPLHGWLVRARVANTAVFGTVFVGILTTAGMFGIVRVLSHVFGVDAPALGPLRLFVVVLAATGAVFGGLMAVGVDRKIDRLVYLVITGTALPLIGVSLIDIHPAIGGLGVASAHVASLLLCLLALSSIDAETQAVEHREAAQIAFWIGAVLLIGLVLLVGMGYLWVGGVGRAPLLLPILAIVVGTHIVALRPVILDWAPWRSPEVDRIEASPGAGRHTVVNWTQIASEKSNAWASGLANAILVSVKYPDQAISGVLPHSLRCRYEQISNQRPGTTGTKLRVVESLYVVGAVLALALVLGLR